MKASLNEKLRNVKWGEFKLVDLFYVKNTSSILSSEVSGKVGNIPYLCASAENNAVSEYIDYDRSFLEKGNCIFIGGKTFVVSYQERDFFSNDSHNLALYPYEEIHSKSTFLFLAACINTSLRWKYSWGNSVSRAKIQNDVLTLPVNAYGTLDYAFMDSFIAELEAERVAELSAYLTVSGLDNYKLSIEEEIALRDYNNQVFDEFDITSVFNIRNTSNILAEQIVEGSGSTPYLCASSENNAVSSYILESGKFVLASRT